MEPFSKDIVTNDGDDSFQIRFIRDEGVGLLTTATGKNYLVLDSIDFWYDLIQEKYPPLRKCKCKNEWFRIRFDYVPRKGTDDIRKIKITAICNACSTEKKVDYLDIKYAPTDHLISNPITFCEKPYIKYDITNINCYWTSHDLKKLFAFISGEMQMDIYCEYWQHSDNKDYFEKISVEKANMIVTVNHRYRTFYFAKGDPGFETHMQNDVPVVQRDQWRSKEYIELDPPFVMAFGNGKKGILFYMHYARQYVVDGNVMDKSPAFKEITLKIENWFRQNNVEARGKYCFDNTDEHKKLFGDKYLKKKKSKS